MRNAMQVSRWGNNLAVRLPKAVVEDLGLKPGDRLEIVSTDAGHMVIAREDRRARVVERMRARAWPMPEGFAFDREEANAG